MWCTQPWSRTPASTSDRQCALAPRRRPGRRTSPAATGARPARCCLRQAGVEVPVQCARRSPASRASAGRSPPRWTAARPAVAVRLLGAADRLQRVEQAQVERRREHAVRQPRVGGQHRVLVRAERPRAGAGGSAAAGPWPPCRWPGSGVGRPGRRTGSPPAPSGRGRPGPRRRCRPPSASAAAGTSSRSTSFGGGSRFSVSRLHRPPTGSPPSTSTPVVLPGEPVERLHPQRAAPLVGPGRRSPSRPVTKPRGGSTVTWSSPRTKRSARREVGWHTSSGSLDRAAAPRVYVSVAQEDRLVAQLGGAVAQGGEDQVRLLPVEGAATEDRLRLDQQHRLLPVVEEVRPQLVGEEPTPDMSRL